MSSGRTVSLSLTKNDAKNTIISGPNNSGAWYYIVTKRSFFHSEPTYIYRQSQSGTKDLVASIEWHSFKDDMITLNGEQRPLEDILPKGGIINAKRRMQTPIGTLEWKESHSKPQLYDSYDRCIADYHSHTLSGKPSMIEVDLDAMSFPDLVVIGWIVVKRDIEKTTENVVIMNEANTVG